VPHFDYEGHRLAYSEYGAGARTVVLVHSILLSQSMHEGLARDLAVRGHRVITVDLLGHGASDRPRDVGAYCISSFGRQIIALLDHLGLDQAALVGTSLGANATLEAAVQAPGRIRGMVVEMPVLDHAMLGCAVAFTPLMVALTVGAPVVRGAGWLARRLPAGRFVPGLVKEALSGDPEPSAALLQGLLFGRIAPTREARRGIAAPTLVIGHGKDPVHPFRDADALVGELADARLLRASSAFELRTTPDRLTGEIDEFLRACWRPREAAVAGPVAAARLTIAA
jgi:pimeloyl-ACP methyl ester carboxylesterase